MSKEVEIIDSYVVRSKTNWGEYAKQYFFFCKADGQDDAIICKKYVLTEKYAQYRLAGYKILKHYKGKALVQQVFAVKLDTILPVIRKYLNNTSTKND